MNRSGILRAASTASRFASMQSRSMHLSVRGSPEPSPRSVHLSAHPEWFMPVRPLPQSKRVNLLFLDKAHFAPTMPASAESTQETALEMPLECRFWDMPFQNRKAVAARKEDQSVLMRLFERLCQQAAGNFELEITNVVYATRPEPKRSKNADRYLMDTPFLLDCAPPSRKLALFR
mmetsp:Transcript_38747/g.91472  ORF Transcript_38747/g.91472 Transcript_38747/m.91472 type:complete len:176 (+) Transcript_38747:260-787(+)